MKNQLPDRSKNSRAASTPQPLTTAPLDESILPKSPHSKAWGALMRLEEATRTQLAFTSLLIDRALLESHERGDYVPLDESSMVGLMELHHLCEVRVLDSRHAVCEAVRNLRTDLRGEAKGARP